MRSQTLSLTARHPLLRASVALVAVWLSGCGDASRTLAQETLSRTIPPGDLVPSLSDPIRAGQTLQFTWDFESHLRSSDYVDWLKTRLPDFRVIDGNESNLHLGKLVGGDAYHLHVAIQPGDGTTRVHVQLTASPD